MFDYKWGFHPSRCITPHTLSTSHQCHLKHSILETCPLSSCSRTCFGAITGDPEHLWALGPQMSSLWPLAACSELPCTQLLAQLQSQELTVNIIHKFFSSLTKSAKTWGWLLKLALKRVANRRNSSSHACLVNTAAIETDRTLSRSTNYWDVSMDARPSLYAQRLAFRKF